SRASGVFDPVVPWRSRGAASPASFVALLRDQPIWAFTCIELSSESQNVGPRSLQFAERAMAETQHLTCEFVVLRLRSIGDHAEVGVRSNDHNDGCRKSEYGAGRSRR